MKGSVNSIETFGLVDGPGIRTVVFLNGCFLRCKFCHNPETWCIGEFNYSTSDIIGKCLRSKPYFKRNNGGVTFSGGEPLLQYDFLLECCEGLKEEGIHVAIDTAGIGLGDYSDLFSNIDLVILDIKHINKSGFIDVTSVDMFDNFMSFISDLNKSGLEVWIRQVIVPGIHDNLDYIKKLSTFIKENIKNVSRVDFLPYHKLGIEKYEALGIDFPFKDKNEMDKERSNQLYEEFLKDFNS